MTTLLNKKPTEGILYPENHCKFQSYGIEICRTALEKKILAGPEPKLPLERRNFGNYFQENEATWYKEHFPSSCITFIALLDKNKIDIKIENFKKSERDWLFRIISGKSVRATEFHASVLENINKSSI